MMAACLHLAWCYVARHRGQTLLLALAMGLVLALPLSIRVVLKAAETSMRARAAATPQVIGARGSSLDLMLGALYFKQQVLSPISASALEEIRAAKLGLAIPVYLRFRAQEAPIVGTTLDYFSFRALTLKEGRLFGRLGDCVVGSSVAARLGVKPGGHVFSSQEQVFDLAGIYPLKMRISGVLAASGTPDDEAVFVDLKTTWLIQGIAHGHNELAAEEKLPVKQKGNSVANASVRLFNEVTEANIRSFHFHGQAGDYPLSALLIQPDGFKAEALLAGRYVKAENPLQIIRPLEEFEGLMNTLFRVETLAWVILGLLSVAAAGVTALVFALSFRLRQRQFATLDDLGVSRTDLVLTKALEVVIVSALGMFTAVIMTLLVAWNAEAGVTFLLR